MKEPVEPSLKEFGLSDFDIYELESKENEIKGLYYVVVLGTLLVIVSITFLTIGFNKYLLILAGLLLIFIVVFIFFDLKKILLDHFINSQLSQNLRIVKSKRNNYLNALKKHEGEQAQYETMLMYSSWQFWLSLGSKELEIQTSNLFTELGYTTSVIGGKNDGGVDIFMVDEDGNKIIVQCKAYKNIVGPNYVRELYGTLMHKKADLAILVAPRGFSYAARDFASGKPIKLYDVDDLSKLTYNFKNYRPYELANAQSMDDVYKYVRKKTGLRYK